MVQGRSIFGPMPRPQHYRTGVWSRALAWCLLIGLLNISIDPPDREARGVAEDTSINEIESVVELVTEELLGMDDFLPEHDESDESGFAKKGMDYRCTRYAALVSKPDDARCVVLSYPFADHFTAQYEPEPRVPPPWA